MRRKRQQQMATNTRQADGRDEADGAVATSGERRLVLAVAWDEVAAPPTPVAFTRGLEFGLRIGWRMRRDQGATRGEHSAHHGAEQYASQDLPDRTLHHPAR